VRAILIALALALMAGPAAADPRTSAPPVTALITYDSTAIDGEGVTRTARYQERLVRAGDAAWIERVMPAGMTVAAPAELHDLDLHLAARWFKRVGDDGVAVGLVSAPAKVVIDLTATEVADLALPARWRTAAELIDVTSLAPTSESKGAARWYASAGPRPLVRVLWSEALRLPLVIETRSADGRASSRTTVIATPLAASAARPWSVTSGYAHKERSDLED
jgi:hypothetical protein